jgi:hypothetical protein
LVCGAAGFGWVLRRVRAFTIHATHTHTHTQEKSEAHQAWIISYTPGVSARFMWTEYIAHYYLQ